MATVSAQRVRATLDPVVTAAGYDLEDVAVSAAGRRSVVRVVVDRDGGVDLDAVADVTRVVSAALDATDVLGDAPYTLEVSSPGVDRPLTAARHWRRAVGRLVRVSLAAGESLCARVVSADDDAVTFDVDGTPRRVPLGELGAGRVQVEFHREGSA